MYNLSVDEIVQASNRYWKSGERKGKAARSGARVSRFVTPRVKWCDILPPRPYRRLPTTTYNVIMGHRN